MGLEYKAVVIKTPDKVLNSDLLEERITTILNKGNEGGWTLIQIATISEKPIAIFSKPN